MIRKLFIVIFLIFFSFSFGKDRSFIIDSLRNELNNKSISDSMRFEVLADLTLNYGYVDFDSTIIYAFHALSCAEKSNCYRQIIRSNLYIANIYKKFSQYYRSLEYETNSIKLAEVNNDSLLLLKSYNSIINTYLWYTKEYDIAKIYLKKSINLANALQDSAFLITNYYRLGILYANTKKYDKSEKYYTYSLNYYQKHNDQQNIANCLNNLGDLKERAGLLQPALKYNKQALSINTEINDLQGIFINTINIASIYGKLGKHEQFFKLVEKETEKAKIEKNSYKKTALYELYYKYYEQQKDYKNSLKYFKLLMSEEKNSSNITQTSDIKRLEIKHILGKVADQKKIYELKIKNKSASLFLMTLLFILSIVIFISSVIYFLKKRKLEELKIKELKTKTELLALQYKINPHFLFNSLNSISQLVISKSGHAEDMIQNLSDLLRYTLTFANKDLVSLEDELDAVNQYLTMEKIRFQERLKFTIDSDDDLNKYFIPPMIILPLAENSIKHGISKLIENGKIYIKIFKENDYLNIFVNDNGLESDATHPIEISKNTGFGHQSIIDRLKITYHGDYKFEISNCDEKYCVKISIPINK